MTGFKAAGLTQRAMVTELTTLGIRTPNGAPVLSLIQVQRVLTRGTDPRPPFELQLPHRSELRFSGND